jgi:hypothetical protein
MIRFILSSLPGSLSFFSQHMLSWFLSPPCALCSAERAGAVSADTSKPASAASAATGGAWKEYTAPDGRKYYHNATTSKTVWTKPDDFDGPSAGGGGGGDKAMADENKQDAEEEVQKKKEEEDKKRLTAKQREAARQVGIQTAKSYALLNPCTH